MKGHKSAIAAPRMSTIIAVISLIITSTAVYFVMPGNASPKSDTEQFCCNCELTWFAEHPNGDIATYRELYDKYCDSNGNPKTKADNSAETPPGIIKNRSYPRQQMLINPNPNLEGFVILDVRAPSEYNKGHIAGARNIYYKNLQSGNVSDTSQMESILRKLGINNSDSLLIYGSALDDRSYAFWALSYLGHKNLSLLSGGLNSAKTAGLKTDYSIPNIRESNYTININPGLLVSPNTLAKWLNRSDIRILDARNWVDYGKSKLTDASLPLDVTLLYDDNNIKDAATIKDIFDRRGLTKNQIQIVYGTPQAYSLFFILRLMGYNATLLEGDWWQNTKWASSSVK